MADSLPTDYLLLNVCWHDLTAAQAHAFIHPQKLVARTIEKRLNNTINNDHKSL